MAHVADGSGGLAPRGRLRWYGGSLVALSFLLISMAQVAVGGGTAGGIAIYEVCAIGFGALYFMVPIGVAGGVSAFVGTNDRTWLKLAALAAMVALTVPMVLVGGVGVSALWIYVAVAGAIMLPARAAMVIALSLAAGLLLLSGLAGDGLPWELSLTLVALTLWMAGFAANIRLTIELRETREELARTAVAAERERIGRDLHDILGHSLTAIAVKAGLARRLLSRDDGAMAAVAEIADIERLAREALGDVRATAAGYRDVSLPGELAVARTVLRAAAIHAEIPTAVDDVEAAGRAVFGYVVREAVTNIVRHSGARHCVIDLDRSSVRITDDGTGDVVPPDGHGGGLAGLAERLADVGGTLSAGPLPGGGFRVTAVVGTRTDPAADDPAVTAPAALDPAATDSDTPDPAGVAPATATVASTFDNVGTRT